MALLADLLSLPASARHPLPNLSPQRKKERTLAALIRQLEGLARRQPMVMIFEDAHWIDPTSRELLDLTVERVRGLPVLLIVTFRPEFQPPWTGQPQVTMLALNRLDRRDRTLLVEEIAGGKALPDEVVVQIADRTDGVPLFVEELTKSVIESGLLREESDRYVLDRALPPLAIPTTLHDSLMARLDRLASVRLVVQIGAAIGREFTYALLRTVSACPKTNCRRLSAGSSPPSWCSSAARRPRRPTASSTRWCRMRRTAACCAAPASNCTRGSPKRSKPFPPRSWTASPSCWRNIMRKPGSSKNPSPIGERLVAGLPPVRRWRKRRRNCRRGWTSWRCCRTARNAGDGSSNCAALWARCCFSSKGPARRKPARPMPARENCGSSWVPPRNSLGLLMGSHVYHLIRGELDRAQSIAEAMLASRSPAQRRGRRRSRSSILRPKPDASRKFGQAKSHLEAGLALLDPTAHRSLVDQTNTHPQVYFQAIFGDRPFLSGLP